MKGLLNTLVKSPTWKTVFGVVLPILAGVFSGTFVTEITQPTGLDWAACYKTFSFYVLLALTGIIYVYNRLLYEREVEITKFSNSEFCLA